MEQRGPSQLGIGLLLLALAGACSSTGVPEPPKPHNEQPRVTVPDGRDARDTNPCALLTDTQLDELRLRGPGDAGRAAEGPHCEWRGSDGRTVLGMTLYTDGGGLVTLARNSEPTTRRVRVAGYPALETFTGRGEFCQYDIGIADAQVVMMTLERHAPDSCSTLQSVVPLVAGNLPVAGSS